MKRIYLLLVPAIIIASCGGGGNNGKSTDINELKKQRADLDARIRQLEAGKKDSSKATPVSVAEVQAARFTGYVEVQASIGGDEVVTATAKSPGTINKVLAQVGQKVHAGQVLATLDATVMEQQIKALEPQLELQKALYDKQQKLWAQNIGTEVQLLSAKAQYEATQKNKAALIAQRDLYNIVSPISGTIDAVSVKVGDVAQPGMNGFHVVNLDKLKAEANLGENYLGKVHQSDPVMLVFPVTGDTIKTKLTYVAESVDPLSCAFLVQVKLGSDKKLHPNMTCIMKIANYENDNAIIVPVSVIQKTSKGDMLFVADGNKAKSVIVQTGYNSNGQVEILSGLSAGDKVITAGFEDLNDGDKIAIAQ